MTDEPRQRLAEGRRLLDAGAPDSALTTLAPLTSHSDREVAGEALLLIGIARYRGDDEPGALSAWQQSAQAGWSGAWLGWRSAAEQLVRDGELEAAISAYREADRRAPPVERGPIANRLAWLLKETGHDFAARRQFNRARGAYASFAGYVTYVLIAINLLVFAVGTVMLAIEAPQLLQDRLFGIGTGDPLLTAGSINGLDVARGEWWRIITSAFLHINLVHIGMNMLVLYVYGPLVEQMYGRLEYLAIYLLCAVGGSVLTILIDPTQSAAGASGAIFGLIGLLFAVSRRHHALLGPQGRRMLAGLGTYVIILLIFTFAVPRVSWTGHVGGMAIGAILGFLLAPSGVQTLGGMWRTAAGEQLNQPMPASVRALVYAGVMALLVAGSYLAVERLAI
jgi:membrane associated rhomboid family serine protease